jgi:hypothetical protein
MGGKNKPRVALDDPRWETMKAWVSDFLWHWQDTGMQCHEAAEVIVSNILTFQQAEDQNGPNLLPEPQSFFESQE